MLQLSTRDVEKVAAHAFDVPETGELALRARLENLRKKGCPRGLVTGRGRVARFDFEQLVDVSVALALIDAGLSPEYAVFAVEDMEGAARDCFAGLAVQGLQADDLKAALTVCRWPADRTINAWCSVHRLLSGPNAEVVRIATWESSEPGAETPPSDTGISAVVIDFGTLFVRLVSAIAAISSEEPLALSQRLLAWSEEHGVYP